MKALISFFLVLLMSVSVTAYTEREAYRPGDPNGWMYSGVTTDAQFRFWDYYADPSEPYLVYDDDDIIIMTPNASKIPIYTNTNSWNQPYNRCNIEGPIIGYLPIPPGFNQSGTTGDNLATAILFEGVSTMQYFNTQPFVKCSNNSGIAFSEFTVSNATFAGNLTFGDHGGSQISPFGAIKPNEIVPGGHINHTFLINVYARYNLNYSSANDLYESAGCRSWRASTCDTGFTSLYRGTNNRSKMGMLVSFANLSTFQIVNASMETEAGRIIAEAMYLFGAVPVDDSAWGPVGLVFARGAYQNETNHTIYFDANSQFSSTWGFSPSGSNTSAFARDMRKIMQNGSIVISSTPTQPGGGVAATRLESYYNATTPSADTGSITFNWSVTPQYGGFSGQRGIAAAINVSSINLSGVVNVTFEFNGTNYTIDSPSHILAMHCDSGNDTSRYQRSTGTNFSWGIPGIFGSGCIVNKTTAGASGLDLSTAMKTPSAQNGENFKVSLAYKTATIIGTSTFSIFTVVTSGTFSPACSLIPNNNTATCSWSTVRSYTNSFANTTMGAYNWVEVVKNNTGGTHRALILLNGSLNATQGSATPSAPAVNPWSGTTIISQNANSSFDEIHIWNVSVTPAEKVPLYCAYDRLWINCTSINGTGQSYNLTFHITYANGTRDKTAPLLFTMGDTPTDTTPPRWVSSSNNGTALGRAFVVRFGFDYLFSSIWQDGSGSLAQWWYNTNMSGTLTNSSAFNFASDNTTTTVLTITAPRGSNFSFRTIANDSFGNLNLSPIFNFTVNQLPNPLSMGINNTSPYTGASINLNVSLQDDIGLSQCVYSSNETGTWTNLSYHPIMNGLCAQNITVTAAPFSQVNYLFYFNDTIGEWNQSVEQSFLTTSENVTLGVRALDDLRGLQLNGLTFNITNGTTTLKGLSMVGSGFKNISIYPGLYNLTTDFSTLSGGVYEGATYIELGFSINATVSNNVTLSLYASVINLTAIKNISLTPTAFNTSLRYTDFASAYNLSGASNYTIYVFGTQSCSISTVRDNSNFTLNITNVGIAFTQKVDVWPLINITSCVTSDPRLYVNFSITQKVIDNNFTLVVRRQDTGAILPFNASLSNSTYSFHHAFLGTGNNSVFGEQGVLFNLTVNSSGYFSKTVMVSGNATAQTFNMFLSSDQDPTTPTIFLPLNNSEYITNSVPVLFNSSHPLNETLTYYLFGANALTNQTLLFNGSLGSFTWSNLFNGTYYLTAMVGDLDANSSNSTITQFTINTGGNISLGLAVQDALFSEIQYGIDVNVSNATFLTSATGLTVGFTNLSLAKGTYNLTQTPEVYAVTQQYTQSLTSDTNFAFGAYAATVNFTAEKIISRIRVSFNLSIWHDNYLSQGNKRRTFNVSGTNLTLRFSSPSISVNYSVQNSPLFSANIVGQSNRSYSFIFNTSDNNLTIHVRDYLSNNTITSVNVTVTAPGYGYAETKSSLTGNVSFAVEQGLSYEVTAGSVGYPSQTKTVLGNASTQSYTFYLLGSNSSIAVINIYDETTGKFLSELGVSDASIQLISPLQATNVSVGNTTTLTNLLPGGYEVRYTAVGYNPRTYYFESVNQTTTTLNLYLLNSSVSSFIPIAVTDTATISVRNATVKALRYYASDNAYKIVAMTRTDENGISNFDLVPNTIWYQFIIDYAGATRLVSVPAKVSGSQLAFVLSLQDNPLKGYYLLGDIPTILQFDNVSSQFIFTWNDLNNAANYGRLTVVQESVQYGPVTICDYIVNSSSGTVACAVPNVTARYLASGFVHTNTTSSEYLKNVLEFDKLPDLIPKDVYGRLGLFLTIMFVAFIMFLGRGNPEISGGLAIAGVIVMGILGVIDITIGATTTLVIFFIIIIMRGQQ